MIVSKKHSRFHPHPAFGHLLPEGEGIKSTALGQAGPGWRYGCPLSQRERAGERENAIN